MIHISKALSHRWVVLGMLMATNVSAFMMSMAFGIRLPSISADLNLSPTRQGFLGSYAFLGNLFLALPLS